MDRRNFLKKTALTGVGLALNPFPFSSSTSHILTLSFDDGFKKSFYRIAEIHENYGLKACLNVIATGHFKNFKTEPQWIPREILGNFDDWNALKNRGHEVMPHTWRHLNLTQIPLKKAKKNIDKCLDYFGKHLEGYSDKGAVYNFAYNASTPELENHALERVSAVRTGGWLFMKDSMLNAIPITELPVRLGCWGHGPDFCDNYVEQEVNKFLNSEGGWLILNLHGLDKEGWGPVSTSYLDRLLKRLVEIEHLAVLPAGEVIQKVKK